MFDKFGEFDSFEEINKKAEELMKAGKEEELTELAKENGIDKEEAEDYYDGATEGLTTCLMAAVGKIKVESESLKVEGILIDWVNVITEECGNDKDFAIVVRKTGKELRVVLSQLIAFAFENKVQVSDRIVDITMVNVNGKKEKMRKPLYLGIPNRAQVKKIVRKYYLG